jgi:exodeoxyribonuclease-3
VFEHPAFDYESRIVTATVQGVTFASIYVPNGGKDFPAKMAFLESLRQYTADLQAAAQHAVLCGDLNIARAEIDVHPKERKPRAIGQLPEERALLERIIANGLVDTGRALAPEDDQMFTWWAPWRNMKERNIGWRLDYVLASAPIFARVEGCVIQREFGTSDHGPVVATFSGFESSQPWTRSRSEESRVRETPGLLFACAQRAENGSSLIDSHA